MNLEKIYQYIDTHRDQHFEKLKTLLMQPSVSPQDIGIKECAELLAKYYEDLHCETEIVKTKGNPVVYGKYNVNAEKTLLAYFMYDTQPYDEPGWTHPPMEAKLAPLELPSGKVTALFNRGAINTKGPTMTFLNAIDSIQKTEGDLPFNLLLVAEGEEELGSPHLPDFVKEYESELKTADACIFPFYLQDTKGNVKLWLGVKGIIYFELECSGKSWGKGPTAFGIHGSNKAWVDSPAWRLVHALSTMTKDNGNTVTVNHFYDDVAPPSKEDTELIQKLVKTFDPEPFKQTMKVDKFIIDEKETETLIKKLLYTSTLNIDGIWGGYIGKGSKTLLPHKATAKIDIRLVPNQERDNMVPLIRDHLDKNGFSDITIRLLDEGYNWSKVSVKEPVVQSMVKTCQSFGYEPEIWPHLAGSAPFYLFSHVLHIPYVMGALGHGARAHSPDEYIVYEGNDKVLGLDGAQKSMVQFLDHWVNQ
ncbi:MAG: M20/M25/M40 family metallo-hydrolase [Candidatus Methanofastidiosia archaeon]|jgi:acetylornithine deacetylase/succinyl-diaminopimelate desuccinylase-like protein